MVIFSNWLMFLSYPCGVYLRFMIIHQKSIVLMCGEDGEKY
jgi:hypothetical protein